MNILQMFKIKFSRFILFSFFALIFAACSASSTGSRYEKENNAKNKSNEENSAKVVEDFDITPYKTKIEIKDADKNSKEINNAWYDYKNEYNGNTNHGRILETVDGYRVLVLATDNMEEANNVRDKLYGQTNHKEVYISFEPPFYKVKVGDFTDLSAANNLKFKLKQLGYTEARVINESVNVFEK